MKNRSLFRLLALAALMLVSGLNARAQAPDAFYVYKNDGSVMPFFNDIVDSVKWSHYDLNGVEHKAYVVQEIYTADSLYRIPVELIDSIGFHKPENKYTADAVRMEQQPWWRYVAEFVDTLNIIKLRKDIPESLLPKVGDKLVTVVQNDIFPGGYMGKVIHIAPDPETGQQLLVCEPLDFKDVFVEFTATAGVVAQSKEAEARSNVRKRHIDLDKTIHWPKIDFLGNSFGLQVGKSEDLGHDVSGSLSGGISWTWEPVYDIEIWAHWSIETGLEYNYVHHGDVNLKRSLNITGTGSWHKDVPFGHIKYAIPNCPLLWWYVEPGVFADFSVSAGINWFTQRKYKTYIFAKHSEYETDLDVYTARTVDEGPGESSTTTFTLSGSLSAGFYTEVGLRVPPYFVDLNNFEIVKDENSKYLIGRLQLGARIEGSAELNMNELIGGAFKDASMYRMLNQEASFALTAFVSGELKLQTPYGGTWSASLPYEVTASLGTKFGIVPSFDNVDVTTGKLDSIYYAICKSDVARNLIFPARNMGFTVRDGKGNTVSRVGNRRYWFTTFENMTDTIRGLEPGIKYTLHPSFDIFGIIPMLGYPNKDFTVGELELDIKPQPIVATRERNVLRLPILTNARRTGVEVVEGAGWLHAVTDSLTLLVRTDSLPGSQPRSGKLMLKATTSDDTNELQIEVYVNQGTDRMIELEPQSLEFPALGGTKQVKATLMEPDRKLSVTGLPEWLKISVSGTTINVTAEQNPDKNRTRTCTLIVLAEDKDGSRAERELKVTQQCDQPAITVEPNVIEVPGFDPKLFTNKTSQGLYMSKTVTLTYIRENNGFDCLSNDESWLRTDRYYKNYKDVDADYYSCTTEVVVFQNNDTKNGREGTITVRLQLKDGTFAEAEVKVIQDKFVPTFEPDKYEVTLKSEGTDYIGMSDYQIINFTTNIPGSMVAKYECIPSDEWLLPNFVNPVESYVGGIRANANYEMESRTGTVTLRIELKDGTVIERIIKVTQQGAGGGDTFDIDPARLEFPGAGGEKTLTIVPKNGAQIDRIWEVDCHTAGNSWLNGSGMNLTAIMYAEPNTTSEWRQRDFAITVLMKDGTKVTQNYVAFQKPAGIDLYPSNSVQFDGLGGFKSMNVESSFEPVTITYDADWLEVERSGNGLFLTAQTNPGDHRSVIVYFTAYSPEGKQVKAQLSVSQTSSTGHFRLEPSSFTFEGEGGTKQSNIFVGKEIKDQVTGNFSASASDSWITCEVIDNGKNLKVTTTANPTAQQREGTVTIYCTLNNGTQLSATHKVTQKAGDVAFFEVGKTTVDFDAEGGTQSFELLTDMTLTTTSPTPSAKWFSVNIKSSGDAYQVNVTAQKYTEEGGKGRAGSFDIVATNAKGQTHSATITVTQGMSEHVQLTVTPESLSFEGAKSTKTATVTNEGASEVRVEYDATWLHPTISGTTITFGVDANLGTTERTVTVTVCGLDANGTDMTPATVTIKQAPSTEAKENNATRLWGHWQLKEISGTGWARKESYVDATFTKEGYLNWRVTENGEVTSDVTTTYEVLSYSEVSGSDIKFKAKVKDGKTGQTYSLDVFTFDNQSYHITYRNMRLTKITESASADAKMTITGVNFCLQGYIDTDYSRYAGLKEYWDAKNKKIVYSEVWVYNKPIIAQRQWSGDSFKVSRSGATVRLSCGDEYITILKVGEDDYGHEIYRLQSGSISGKIYNSEDWADNHLRDEYSISLGGGREFTANGVLQLYPLSMEWSSSQGDSLSEGASFKWTHHYRSDGQWKQKTCTSMTADMPWSLTVDVY